MSKPELDRYEVLGELGQGGMSVVYRARDRQLSRDVALKVLHDFLARQPDARRRFHREAVAVAKLHHPGILEIFDYSGPDADQAYIVTELIEGKTLRAFVEGLGRIKFPELGALLVAELVRALRHAHEQGVVHRDLKPENIMITKSGQLKLMDFGIAQIMGGATKLTATGTLLGSPAHMAPEVIDGKPSDHRCDIFSLGTILYWLCAGELPFSAPNPSALFRKILEGTYEPPQLTEPKIGNGLSRVIERALTSNPEERYQDVSDLERDLLEELSEVGIDPPAFQCKQFLLDPRPFSDAFEAQLIERLTESGETALSEGNVGKAMDRFNRVLAIDPHNEKAKTLSARIGRRARITRTVKQVAMAVLLLCLVGGAAFGASRLFNSPTLPKAKAAEPPPPPTVAIAPPTPIEPPPPLVVVEEPPAPSPKRTDTDRAKAKTKPKTARADRIAPARGKPERPKVVQPRVVGVMATPVVAEIKEPPPVEVLPEPTATIRVRIGRGFADVHVDDQVFPNTVHKDVELEVGQHQIYVEKKPGQVGVAGRYAVQLIEVDEQGGAWLIEGGKRRRKVRELRFNVARSLDEITQNPARFKGWTTY